MEHLYFLQNLNWKANGTYYDEKENSYPLNGEVTIVKTENKWTLEGFLEVLSDNPLRFTNNYNILKRGTSLMRLNYQKFSLKFLIVNVLNKIHKFFKFLLLLK